ncbi:DNA replication and repair protein RecF [Candidatus Peregrinibacteria bacterium]|nr:DNA replication and repair protein RecF [Candidatus Peregrinibacteria bacterium]
MRLLSLALQNFRSYPTLRFPCSGGMHLLVGPNGSGKTNLLEAIALLGLGRSCRGVRMPHLGYWDSSFFRVRGEGKSDRSREMSLEVVFESHPPRSTYFLRDGQVSLGKFLGRFPVALFLPDDLHLFRGPPNLRRRFLDRILTQVYPWYLPQLLQYRRVLHQRNGLLKHVPLPADSEFLPWEQKLARLGSAITLARLEFLETLQMTFLRELVSMGLPWSDALFRYMRATVSRDAGALEQEYVSLLQASRARDALLRSTTVGPHREDWRIEVQGRDLVTFASRGEQRLIFLALLLLSAAYLELRRLEKPVILLDDLFSELDIEHQQILLQMLSAFQVFITATQVPQDAPGELWHIGGGQVRLGTMVHSS